MASLADTPATLFKLRRQAEALSAKGDAGPGGMDETKVFGGNPGALRMLSYVPDGLPAGAPLVVVLHGCVQRAEAHAAAGGWLALADRYGFAVLAPEQSPSNNPNRCFNWFEPGDTRRDLGEAASIRAMIAHAVDTHRLDPSRVFVTGLSAGGAMTAVMLAAYPEVFAAGAVVAGLAYGLVESMQGAFQAMHGGVTLSPGDLAARVRRAAPIQPRYPRLSIWQGDADTTVRPANAVELAKQWTALHGLPSAASEVLSLPGVSRAVWRDGHGEVVVESNLVYGLGHGTPLAAAGPDGVGTPAPFMLEAGVSSALEICRFWGLTPLAIPLSSGTTSQEPRPDRRTETDLGGQILASVARHVPGEVQDVITRALKSAGLMR